ncbi:MAG: TCR/Tet family MFS transporter [Caulobacterales bacterium]|jgi:DHA1 family tetracycline resistance protein-like MFS transporter
MTDAVAAAPPPRKAAFAFVFVTVLLDTMALGIVVPVLPTIVLGFVDNDTAQAAHVVGALGAFWATMQFVSMPFLGALSDQFGRRPVILISNFGMAAAYLIVATAPSLIWIFASRILSGIAAASVSTANAYIADVTPPDQRAARFGVLGAAFGAGFVLGPAIGGLLGAADPRLPYWAAAICSLVNATYGVFVLPESLAKENRRTFSWRRANPVGAFDFLRERPQIAGLAGARFLEGLAQVVLPSSFVLYASHRYGWDTATIGLTLGMVGVSSVLVNVFLVRRVVRALGERRALLTGLVCGALGFAVYGTAPTGALFWLGIPLQSCWAIGGAAAQSILTRQVEPNEQGQLQGALAAVMGVGGMIGPPLFTTIFAIGIAGGLGADLPGAPYYLGALFLVGAWTIARAATRPAA